MNYSYKKKGGHYQVFDESGRYVCNVKRKEHGYWMAWVPPNTLGQHAKSRVGAVTAEMQYRQPREG